MDLVHMGGAPEQVADEYLESEAFDAIGLKVTYIQNPPFFELHLIHH